MATSTPIPTALPTTIRVTQAGALLLSTLASGTSLTLSTFLVPRLLESPTPVMLTQWTRTYALGTAVMPLTCLMAGGAYLYLGISKVAEVGLFRSRAYLAAGALTLGIIPFTILAMAGTNNALKSLEAEAGMNNAREVEKKGEVEAERLERSAKGLVDWWGVLNLGRAGLLIAGAVCGLVATV